LKFISPLRRPKNKNKTKKGDMRMLTYLSENSSSDYYQLGSETEKIVQKKESISERNNSMMSESVYGGKISFNDELIYSSELN
jgi:hypothetical protein